MKLSNHQARYGFSRSELCVVLSAGLVLAATLDSSLARSREPGHRIGCVNNLRQLGMAALIYSSENDGMFPPRASNTGWPSRLQRYYGDLAVLRCPNDASSPRTFGTQNPADAAPRSYIFNGWDDYFAFSPTNQAVFPESAIRFP